MSLGRACGMLSPEMMKSPLAATLGAFVTAGGCVSLLGWALDVPRLTDWAGQGISIQPNACIAAICAGLAVLLGGLGRARAAAVAGASAGLIGIATLIEHATGSSLGIDDVTGLVRDWGGAATRAPGRMGPPAATCWTLAGIGSVLLASRGPARRFVPVIGLVILGLGVLSVTGYTFGVDPLFRVPQLTAIALQTAWFVAATGAGLVACAPERDPMRTLRADTSAGMLARRLLPPLVVLPLLLGYVIVTGRHAQLYDGPMAVALLVLALVVALCAVAWWSAKTISRREAALAAANEARARADRELRRKEALLSAVLEQLPVGVGVLDADGRWSLGNPALGELAGAGDPDADWPALRALHGEAVAATDWLARRPDGTTAWLRVSAAPLRDQDGALVGATAVVQDVDQRKRAAEALAAAERQLRLVTDHAPVMLAQCDASRRFKFVNAAYARRFGREPAELIGRTVGEVVGPETAAQLEPRLRAVLEGREVTFEATLPLPGGEVQHVRAAYAPERDASGATVGFVAAVIDITDRQRAEESLRRSERKFMSVFHDAPLAMVLVSVPDGRISDANEQWLRLFELSRDEIVGRTTVELGLIEDAAGRDAAVSRLVGAEAVAGVEVRVRSGRGRSMITSSSSNRIDVDGRPHLLVGVQDVTARRAAEDALREADRRKDEFLATLAHELRNPLAPIASSLEILRHAGGDEAVMAQAQATMGRQLRHVVRLIDDLLDVSRITRNKLELRRQAVLLGDVVDQAVESCRPLLRAAGQELRVSLPELPVMLDADPVRLAQVLVNLLTNASKFSPPGSPIDLRAELAGSGLEIRVSDRGAGIAADQLDRVFDLFTQVRRPDHGAAGLGIGLSLARRLVEMHDGTLVAQSAGEGHGTTLVIRLPVPSAPPEPAVSKPAEGPASEGRRARRVLVVDDNRDAAASLELLLRLQGMTTRVAHDGVEAVEAAGEFRPDVVLLDIGLPRMDGHAACREIRKQPWGREIRIVALTGWGQDADRRRSEEAGFDEHLVKPVDPPSLLRVLAG